MPALNDRSLQPVQERYRQLRAQEPTSRERLISRALVAIFLMTIVVVTVLFVVFVLFAPRA